MRYFDISRSFCGGGERQSPSYEQRSRVLRSDVSLVAAGAALFAVSDNFLLLLAGRALIGLGVAASLTSGLKALVLWFPKDRIPLLNGLMIMPRCVGRRDGNVAS